MPSNPGRLCGSTRKHPSTLRHGQRGLGHLLASHAPTCRPAPIPKSPRPPRSHPRTPASSTEPRDRAAAETRTDSSATSSQLIHTRKHAKLNERQRHSWLSPAPERISATGFLRASSIGNSTRALWKRCCALGRQQEGASPCLRGPAAPWQCHIYVYLHKVSF